MEMNKKTQFNVGYWIAAFSLLMAFQYLFTMATQVAQIPYSQFETYLNQGKIAEVAVSDRFIQGRFKEPIDGRPMFITTRVEPDLARQLQDHGVVVTGQIESTFLRDLLSWVIPVLVFAAVWMFILKRMGGGISGGLVFGASETRFHGTVTNIRRATDVAGTYGAAGAGAAIGAGMRVIQLRNEKGAILRLQGRQVGLMANIDLSGLVISMR